MPASMDRVSSLIALSWAIVSRSCLVYSWKTHQSVGLPDLLGRLLETALGRVNLAVAAVNVVLHVPVVVEFEAPPALLVGVCLLVLRLERLVVHLWAGPQLVLGVGEEVVGAVADEVGAADLGVGDAELRRALVGAAHGLLAHELLCVGVSIVQAVLWLQDIPSSLRVSAAAILSIV